ncbi:MAG: thioredoxin domain-containing protein [Ignavibacteria bacterium]|nr:thioredoxin domain-containing protein [Ignavibacteria bacterium]
MTQKSNTHAREPNSLIYEVSPYLLQHAYNPIEWHSWNDDTFKKAEKLQKLIFLSIGYSTCHWCHVMEDESFEDEEVASILNEYFIPIKLDREERPDIDAVYMEVCQALTGHGGWPSYDCDDSCKKAIFCRNIFSKISDS